MRRLTSPRRPLRAPRREEGWWTYRALAALVTTLSLGGAGSALATDVDPYLGPAVAVEGAVSIGHDPVARLRSARLKLAVPGGRLERTATRTMIVRRVRFGTRVMVIGSLRTADGRAVNAANIEVRDHRGRVLGRARTDVGGTFTAWVHPHASGVLRVGLPIGQRLVPPRGSRALRVLVRPRVRLAASTSTPRVGQAVVFTGSIHPSPRSVSGPARKVIALEWRDPLRGTWRPVVNARARADGTFRITWRFGLRGLTIPMRVRVPTEGDWPLLGGLSREIPLTIR